MSDDTSERGRALVPQARDDASERARTREVRERVIERLCDHFAHDSFGMEELERRVTIAHTSESPGEMEALLDGLPALADGGGGAARAVASAGAATRAIARAPAASVAHDDGRRHTMLAIMSGIDRSGVMTLPRRSRIVSIMGGARIDLREARFPAGVTDIEIVSFMGGTEIIVPPGLAVQTHGAAIMGGFQDLNRAPVEPDPDAPLLRVHGFVMMGGVDVKMRLPGETARDERRRQRHERRSARRAKRELE